MIDSLLDDAPCGFLAFDDDGNVLLVNATLAAWLGYSDEQIVGQPLERLLPPGGVIFHQTHFFPMLKLRGHVEETYLSLKAADGSALPMLVNAKRQPHGEGMRSDCILVPMQQRHHFEEELLRTRRAAEAARDAKARFLSMLAHEVRSPLTAITGLAHVLLQAAHGPLHPEQAEDVRLILKAGQDVDRLIADVLRYASAEAGHDAGERVPILLEDALLHVEALMRTRWEAGGLTYRRSPESCAFTVLADPQRLQQILLNLLSNAAKFTPRGGQVCVDCRMEAAEQRVRIEVSDTGEGIPDDALERIFEPFVQVGRSSQVAASPGAGLGLAISREFAASMQGTLTARNAEQGGAVFVLALPAVAAPEAAGAASA